MKRSTSTLVALLAVGTRLMAASDYLLEIDGIKGESKDDAHQGTIEIASWSFGASNPAVITGTGLSAGKVSMQDFHFSMRMDASTPFLFAKCATGKHIAKATLYVRKAGDDKRLDYLTITLSDILVSSIRTESSSGDRPTESLSFTYSRIEFNYKAVDAAGAVEEIPPFSFDLFPVIQDPTGGTTIVGNPTGVTP